MKKNYLFISSIACCFLISCNSEFSKDFYYGENENTYNSKTDVTDNEKNISSSKEDEEEKDNTKDDELINTDQNKVQYLISFIVDGVVTKKVVDEYALPSFGSIPTRKSTNQYEYTFSNWEPKIVPATKNTTYTAVFSAKEILFNISFKFLDEIVQSEKLKYGVEPKYNGDLIGENNYVIIDDILYSFNGWIPTITVAKKDQIYVADLVKLNATFYYCWLKDGTTEQVFTTKLTGSGVKIYSKRVEDDKVVFVETSGHGSIEGNQLTVSSGQSPKVYFRRYKFDDYLLYDE